MRTFMFFMAIVALVLGCAGLVNAYTAGDPECRAIYVDTWHAGMYNSAQIDQLVAYAHSVNANTIIAEVRRRGDTAYPSREPLASGFSSSFDSLAYLIQKCHSTSPRLDVQAWFVIWAIQGDPPTTNANHPYNKYPQYLTKDENGSTLCADDYWFDPGNPNAEQYTYSIIKDAIDRYDVDGINLDYIRFGGNHMGYNDASVARFNAAYGRSGKPVYNDADWSDWRRTQVTNFVRKVYLNAISTKPQIKVTADVIAGSSVPSGPATFSGCAAYKQYFQDWHSWMQEGILDTAMPMDYIDCDGSYSSCYEPWVSFTGNYDYNRQSMIAAGVYSASCMVSQLSATRNPSYGPPNGAGVYCYNSVNSSITGAIQSVWNTPAPIPAMPWKTSPTKGHMMGNVTFGGGAWVDMPTISITGPESRSRTGDGTGFYGFVDLTPGTYTVTCTAPAYGTLTKACVVTAGQVASADFDYPLSSLTISAVAVNEASTSATVTWTTNGPASSKVYYGPDRSCAYSTAEDSTQVTSHSVTVTGLQPMTPYFFRVYSKNPAAPAAISEISIMITKAVSPDFIIESRSGGQNYSCYSESNMSDNSSAKSTASGCTAGIGSRYGSLQASYARSASYKPAIPIAGNYNVYVTWGTSSSGASNVKHTVTYNGGSYETAFNQATNANTWNLIGTFPFAAGASGSCGEVKQWADALEAGKRITADAVRFAMVADTTAPSKPLGLRQVGLSDDFVNLAWAPCTDNVGIGGYRVYRDGYVIDTSPTNAYADTTVAPNRRYTYMVSSYDTSGNKSANSSNYSVCTLPALPTSATVTCDKPAGVWQTSGPFTFTAVGGFGIGKINYYRYAWDTSLSHEWTGAETAWADGNAVCAATSSSEPYYLHIKGYNMDGVSGEAADLGPYYVDSTAPNAPVVVDDGAYSTSQTSVHASWSANEPESGIIGYKYAVGTTSGATNLVGWTSTTNSEGTITIPSQPVGATVYVSVMAQNGAKQWSSAGTSDGIKIAKSIATVADAKKEAESATIHIAGATVTGVFSGYYYIEDDSRTSGIRCEGSCPYPVGSRVYVGGVLGQTSAKERMLLSASVGLLP